MTAKFLLNICLKIMGVYYALSALNTLPASILQTVIFWNAGIFNRQQNDPFGTMISYKTVSLVGLLIPFLLFFFSLLIIFKSERISSFVCKKGDTITTHGDILPATALNISIKIFGFFSLLTAIPYVSDLLSHYWVMKENLKLYEPQAKIKLASSAICVVLYICIGLILIFYSSAITDRFLKADSKKPDEEDATEA